MYIDDIELNVLLDKWDFEMNIYFDKEKKSYRYMLKTPMAVFDSIDDVHNWILEEFEKK